jgi:hypothetical protein
MAPSPQPPQQAPTGGWLGALQTAVVAGAIAILAWTAQQQLEQTRLNQQMVSNMSMTTDKLDELCKRLQVIESWRNTKDAQDAEQNARLNHLERGMN